jgi:hypothetical protein
VADRYDRLTTAQLEEEAASRSPVVDLTAASTNDERRQLLRADDEIHGTAAEEESEGTAEVGSEVGSEVEAEAEEASEATAEVPANGGQVGQSPDSATNPLEPAPYVSQDDLANRQAAAAGETEYAQQPEGEVPQVGGQANDET